MQKRMLQSLSIDGLNQMLSEKAGSDLRILASQEIHARTMEIRNEICDLIHKARRLCEATNKATDLKEFYANVGIELEYAKALGEPAVSQI